MTTKTNIGNMALSNISATGLVSNIDTDTSINAKTLRIYYEPALRYVLEDVDWNFATGRQALAKLEETAPADWAFVYTLPADCVKPREIYTSTRRTQRDEVPFEVGLSAARDKKVLFTDQDAAELRFTAYVTDPNLMPASFQMMFARYLGFLISPALTKKKAVTDEQFAKYEKLKVTADVSDIEAGTQDAELEGEFLQARK